MLNENQLQELHALTAKYKPMYIWNEISNTYINTASPATASFILDAFNKPKIIQEVAALTRLPLYPSSRPLVLYVLDHPYWDLSTQQELFFNKNPVRYNYQGEQHHPTYTMQFSWSNIIPYLSVGLNQALWVFQFCHFGNAEKLCNVVEKKSDEFAENFDRISDVVTASEQVEDGLKMVLALMLISNLLEQYINFFVLQKYQYSWDGITAHFTMKYVERNLYLQSLIDLKKVSAKAMTMDDYIAKYGDSGFVDYELSSPRFSEDSEKLQARLQEMSNWHEPKVKTPLPSLNRFERSLLETFWLVEATRGSIRMKSTKIVGHLRKLLLDYGKAKNIPEHLIFFIRKDELFHKPEAFLQEAEQRRLRFAQNTKVKLPLFLTEEAVTTILRPYIKGGKNHVIPISPGLVTGKIHKIKSLDNTDCEKGCVLLIPDGDPKYTQFYTKGSAIIFEKGGAITHGAILARENKIPAISLGGQQFSLEQDMVVSIDGEQGILEIK